MPLKIEFANSIVYLRPKRFVILASFLLVCACSHGAQNGLLTLFQSAQSGLGAFLLPKQIPFCTRVSGLIPPIYLVSVFITMVSVTDISGYFLACFASHLSSFLDPLCESRPPCLFQLQQVSRFGQH